jgi:purine nucleoside permease
LLILPGIPVSFLSIQPSGFRDRLVFEFFRMLSVMRAAITASVLFANALAALVPAKPAAVVERASESYIKPKIFIISMFDPEGEAWYGIPEFDILAMNVTVPGFSPLYPDAHCTADGEICQLTTGESEINAATTIASLVRYSKFDLTSTYFMIAGIAGVNPEVASICSVTFARFAVQVALQYEFSQFEIPSNFSSGYIPQGSTSPDEYPQSIYGTEVFEVNQDLQHMAAEFARKATLNDSDAAIAYRANYAASDAYTAGATGPQVYECDVATSDVYYSGDILSTAFGNYTTLVTNGTGNYCTTAQEDNATLEALLRAAVNGLVDFSRIIVMRTASDFDRPYPGEAATYNLWYADQGSFEPSIRNIYLAGIEVVNGILDGWNTTFAKGVNASNYIGTLIHTRQLLWSLTDILVQVISSGHWVGHLTLVRTHTTTTRSSEALRARGTYLSRSTWHGSFKMVEYRT